MLKDDELIAILFSSFGGGDKPILVSGSGTFLTFNDGAPIEISE